MPRINACNGEVVSQKKKLSPPTEISHTFKIASPAGGSALDFTWRRGGNNTRVAIEMRELMRGVLKEFAEINAAVGLHDKSLDKVNWTDVTEVKEYVDRYNRSTRTVSSLWKGATKPSNEVWASFVCAEQQLLAVCRMAFLRSVPDVKRLNHHYQPFSSEVYGETSLELVARILEHLKLRESRDVFVDLGSGVGHVVAFVSGDYRVRKAVGIEKSPLPAEYARTLGKEFRKVMSWHGKRHRPFELHEGDFLEEKYRQLITEEATVLFVNNFAFTPELNARIKARLIAPLRNGTRIISTKEFAPLKKEINRRHMNDVTSILDVEQLPEFVTSGGAGNVSWTSNNVKFFIHTVNHARLEQYYQKNRPRSPSTNEAAAAAAVVVAKEEAVSSKNLDEKPSTSTAAAATSEDEDDECSFLSYWEEKNVKLPKSQVRVAKNGFGFVAPKEEESNGKNETSSSQSGAERSESGESGEDLNAKQPKREKRIAKRIRAHKTTSHTAEQLKEKTSPVVTREHTRILDMMHLLTVRVMWQGDLDGDGAVAVSAQLRRGRKRRSEEISRDAGGAQKANNADNWNAPIDQVKEIKKKNKKQQEIMSDMPSLTKEEKSVKQVVLRRSASAVETTGRKEIRKEEVAQARKMEERNKKARQDEKSNNDEMTPRRAITEKKSVVAQVNAPNKMPAKKLSPHLVDVNKKRTMKRSPSPEASCFQSLNTPGGRRRREEEGMEKRGAASFSSTSLALGSGSGSGVSLQKRHLESSSDSEKEEEDEEEEEENIKPRKLLRKRMRRLGEQRRASRRGDMDECSSLSEEEEENESTSSFDLGIQGIMDRALSAVRSRLYGLTKTAPLALKKK